MRAQQLFGSKSIAPCCCSFDANIKVQLEESITKPILVTSSEHRDEPIRRDDASRISHACQGLLIGLAEVAMVAALTALPLAAAFVHGLFWDFPKADCEDTSCDYFKQVSQRLGRCDADSSFDDDGPSSSEGNLSDWVKVAAIAPPT